MQPAQAQVLLAKGLTATYVTRSVANSADMLAFWPNDTAPTHLIFCIEGGRKTIGTNSDGSAKLNPSVQAVAISNGEVQTILRGMSGCDGIRRTPWGTILVTEEEDGGAYEIIQPMEVIDAVVLDRATGAVSDESVVKRNALPTMTWEGLEVLPTGVVVGGDELRPGTARADVDGGSIFKFVPTKLRNSTAAIKDLAESPLASGTVYAMQVSCVAGRQQFGQGCEIGNAAWIPVSALTARSDAAVQGATGYYRPEDLHLDPRFADAANPAAVRFCWVNTGNSGATNFAEVLCAVDRSPSTATPTSQSVVVTRFIEGDEDFKDDALEDITEHLLETEKPRLLLMHLVEVDTEQHRHGIGSPQAQAAIKKDDAQVERVLRAIERNGLLHETALIVASDHGFREAPNSVRPCTLLTDAGFVTQQDGKIIDWKATVHAHAGEAYVYLKDPKDTATAERVRELFTTQLRDPKSGIVRLYDATELQHLGGDTTALLALGAAPGYQFASGCRGAYRVESNSYIATHGFEPGDRDMRASLLMVGPTIPHGTIAGARLIDIAPTIAEWLGLPMPGVDGKALRVTATP
jgi:hypothetical protein